MDIEHFFFVDETTFQHLRPAAEEERKWYHALSLELRPFQENINRFERVEDSFSSLVDVLKLPNPSAAQLERKAKSAVAGFLYAFNEFLDHWKTYIIRSYGENSDYFLRYKRLTSRAFDEFDEYKITYSLRNFQHVDDVVDGVSAFLSSETRLYASRRRLLDAGHFTKPQRLALERQPDRFELFPIFKAAKEQLEHIEKCLMFYAVTKEQEEKALQALAFKEQLCGAQGALLLGKLLDKDGHELEAIDGALPALALEQGTFQLVYQDEIPWGVCTLLKLFQGTDYTSI